MKNKPDSLTEKVDAAFRAAAFDVIEIAKRTGTPVITWQDGQIKEVPPEQIEARLKQQEEEIAVETSRP